MNPPADGYSRHDEGRLLLDWKVLPELPNPGNFESATDFVTQGDVADAFACGPERKRHLAVARPFVKAGFDHAES